MKILFRIVRYMRPYWRIAVVVYSCLIGVTLITLVSPWLIGEAVDTALGQNDSFPLFPDDWSDKQKLAGAASLIVGLALLRGGINFGQRYGTQWLGRKVAYDLRLDLYLHLQRLPFSFYDRTRIGQLMSRAIGDVDEIRFFAGIVIGDIINLIVLLTGIYAMTKRKEKIANQEKNQAVANAVEQANTAAEAKLAEEMAKLKKLKEKEIENAVSKALAEAAKPKEDVSDKSSAKAEKKPSKEDS